MWVLVFLFQSAHSFGLESYTGDPKGHRSTSCATTSDIRLLLFTVRTFPPSLLFGATVRFTRPFKLFKLFLKVCRILGVIALHRYGLLLFQELKRILSRLYRETLIENSCCYNAQNRLTRLLFDQDGTDTKTRNCNNVASQEYGICR